MRKTGTTDRALLTIHMPEPNVRHRRSESTTLAAHTLLTDFQTCLSLVGFLFSSRSVGSQRDRGMAKASMIHYVCALKIRYTLMRYIVYYSLGPPSCQMWGPGSVEQDIFLIINNAGNHSRSLGQLHS
uniref:Kinesin motor domain-containing protein n=1 Tax=Mesocestoides corti TaxID=53468 RepID=A0A5K3EVJ3_MESCO